MSKNQMGEFRIHLDGQWDLDDLSVLANAFKGSYAYFYAVKCNDDEEREFFGRMIADHFWSGDYQTSRFGEHLYRNIPDARAIKIRRIRYASPGIMELAGVLAVLVVAAKAARGWISVGKELLDLYERISEFFQKRRYLVRPPRNFSLDQFEIKDIDEALSLFHEFGKHLGFDDTEREQILNLATNPVAGLKFMVALANETRRVAKLENNGLMTLPDRGKPIDEDKAPEK